MENDEIKKIGAMAVSYARKKGLNEHLAKDFRQDFLLKNVVRGKNQSLSFCFIDFLRRNMGDARTRKFHFSKIHDEEWTNLRQVPTPYDLLIVKETRFKNMRTLTGKQRMLVRMLARHTQSSVSSFLGIRSAGIPQRMATIKKRLCLSIRDL